MINRLGRPQAVNARVAYLRPVQTSFSGRRVLRWWRRPGFAQPYQNEMLMDTVAAQPPKYPMVPKP